MLLMVIAALFMLAGVIPLPGGREANIFSSPVFILILLLLAAATLLCAVKRRLTVRSAGFHLTHLGVAVFAVGATVGLFKEKSATFRIFLEEPIPVRMIKGDEGGIIEFGFGLTLNSFRVDHYLPDIHITSGGETIEKIRIKQGKEIDLGDETKATIDRISTNIMIKDVELEGSRLLTFKSHAGAEQSIDIGTTNAPAQLADNHGIEIIKVYNNLPHMRMGERFRESSLPLRPGVILKVVESNKQAIVSVPADGDTVVLSPRDPELMPDIPEFRYVSPAIKTLSLAPSADGMGQTAVQLSISDGGTRVLVQGPDLVSSYPMANGNVLRLSRSIDRFYEGTMITVDDDGASVAHTFTVNRPVNHKGWRFYLNDYDRENLGYIILSARKDPGDKAAVAGIIMIMVGIALLFYTRRPARRIA